MTSTNGDRPLQFVDTNVLVYAHDVSAGPKHKRAEGLLADLWNAGSGCVSIQVLQEFYVNVIRRIARPLPMQTAADHVEDLGQWRVHAPGVPDVLAAIELHRSRQISFWDAMVLRSAAQLGCDVLWSEDLNAGQSYGGVRVLNPFAT